ncbi:GntR family transcriptional regulator [Streptomyces sp. NPDC059452]|uniref:GntR family transcriptional regulator n=1 Tax=Streptomyces sp. NPDC059452 TaxID=3346835 RepID=UPI0036A182E1
MREKADTERPVPPLPASHAHQLARRSRRRIVQGTWLPSTQIPTRARLVEEANVTADVVSAILKMPTAEGLLISIRGSGTHVATTAQARVPPPGRLRRGGDTR